ncbi:hypothetical protein LCGC14_2398770 [marine sediment metagenome]|uniref:Uncharacterized protein n=1 Tax=marine sediment metagenome TaxID=412755 RepID=A0A0F9BW12_9ZZZZ
MGIILILFLLTLGITGLTIHWSHSLKKENAKIAGVVCTIISLVIVIIILSCSYADYVIIRTHYDATIAQYKGAVTMYADRASIDVKKIAFVDFKYKGYQNNMAGFIRDLRRAVVKYNKELISKRVMDKSFMFNWLIIAPDKDMKIINMIEEEEG